MCAAHSQGVAGEVFVLALAAYCPPTCPHPCSVHSGSTSLAASVGIGSLDITLMMHRHNMDAVLKTCQCQDPRMTGSTGVSWMLLPLLERAKPAFQRRLYWCGMARMGLGYNKFHSGICAMLVQWQGRIRPQMFILQLQNSFTVTKQIPNWYF